MRSLPPSPDLLRATALASRPLPSGERWSALHSLRLWFSPSSRLRCELHSLRTFFRITTAAGGRRLDDDRFIGVDDGGVAALQLLATAVAAAHGILAHLARFAAGKPERPHAAVTG